MRLIVNPRDTLLLIPSAAQTRTTAAAPKPRVFISDSQSWQRPATPAALTETFAAHSSGGARPETSKS